MAVIPDTLHQLHTTRSWDFLGLTINGQISPAWSSAKLGVDTIIGSIDTGSPLSYWFFNVNKAQIVTVGHMVSVSVNQES